MIQRVYQSITFYDIWWMRLKKIGVTETDELHVCSCTFVNVYGGIVEILLPGVPLCFVLWVVDWFWSPDLSWVIIILLLRVMLSCFIHTHILRCPFSVFF